MRHLVITLNVHTAKIKRTEIPFGDKNGLSDAVKNTLSNMGIKVIGEVIIPAPKK